LLLLADPSAGWPAEVARTAWMRLAARQAASGFAVLWSTRDAGLAAAVTPVAGTRISA
jgi:hypothetical protein